MSIVSKDLEFQKYQAWNQENVFLFFSIEGTPNSRKNELYVQAKSFRSQIEARKQDTIFRKTNSKTKFKIKNPNTNVKQGNQNNFFLQKQT